MKKARTLLAIWLALILTLTLFPTALADGGDKGTNPDPNGGAATFQPQQVYVDLTNAKITDLNPGQQFNSSEDGATITFKIAEGYEWDFFQVYVTSHVTNQCTLTVDETTGVYTLTIPAEVITNKVTVKLFTEKAATPSTDTDGDGSDDGQTTPSTPQGGGFNPDEGGPGGSGTPAESGKTFTIRYAGYGEGVTVTPPPTVKEGESFTVKDSIPTYGGFNFKGWERSDTKTIVDPKDSFIPESDVTLTAVWVENVKITYTEGSDSWSETPDVGTTYTIAAPKLTPNSKIFTGWKSGDTIYKSGDKLELKSGDADLTLTAQYDDKVIVKFAKENNSGNVSGMPSDTEAPYNQSYKLPTKEPSRTDGSYEFGRWRLNFNGKTYTYSAGATINWASIGVDAGDTVTFIADFDHHYYADYDEDDDKPSKPSKPTYDEYRIRATCSDGGWVSPAGSTYVREGRNLTVTFAPYKGYAIDGVYIDGVLDNRYDGSYTFRDVDENHTIYVRYVRDSGSSGGSSGGGSHWDDNTSPKTGDASAPLSMGLGVGSLALIAFLVARKMRRA